MIFPVLKLDGSFFIVYSPKRLLEKVLKLYFGLYTLRCGVYIILGQKREDSSKGFSSLREL